MMPNPSPDKPIELKACPFCGSNDLTPEHLRISRLLYYAIYCRQCGGASTTIHSDDEAVKRWNTRAEVSQLAGGVGERERLQAKVRLYAQALFQMRDMLTAVHDGLEDEGDRVYLGSTNHAELLHEAWHFADALRWDEIMDDNKDAALSNNPGGSDAQTQSNPQSEQGHDG